MIVLDGRQTMAFNDVRLYELVVQAVERYRVLFVENAVAFLVFRIEVGHLYGDVTLAAHSVLRFCDAAHCVVSRRTIVAFVEFDFVFFVAEEAMCGQSGRVRLRALFETGRVVETTLRYGFAQVVQIVHVGQVTV